VKLTLPPVPKLKIHGDLPLHHIRPHGVYKMVAIVTVTYWFHPLYTSLRNSGLLARVQFVFMIISEINLHPAMSQHSNLA
jgi:hypothetical protein